MSPYYCDVIGDRDVGVTVLALETMRVAYTLVESDWGGRFFVYNEGDYNDLMWIVN